MVGERAAYELLMFQWHVLPGNITTFNITTFMLCVGDL